MSPIYPSGAGGNTPVPLLQPFLASDFIHDEELPRLLKSAQNDGCTVFPLIVGHCTYRLSSLAKFQASNGPDEPLESLNVGQQNKILVRVAEEISAIMNPPSARRT